MVPASVVLWIVINITKILKVSVIVKFDNSRMTHKVKSQELKKEASKKVFSLNPKCQVNDRDKVSDR